MHDHDNDIDPDELYDGPSKSAVKREMHALQALGKTLTELNDKQLASMPIDDERLLEAIRETRRISSKNALKRHMQFVGKLMRDVDPEPIEAALEKMRRPQQQKNALFHQLETLRDDSLKAGLPGVEMIMQHYPTADRQQLRQLILQHQREMKQQKPPAASRKLFKYLREQQELADQGEDWS